MLLNKTYSELDKIKLLIESNTKDIEEIKSMIHKFEKKEVTFFKKFYIKYLKNIKLLYKRLQT
jgi:hypothetical protein